MGGGQMPWWMKRHRALSAIVKRAIDGADPEGLLAMDCPPDEYDGEVAMVSAALSGVPKPTVGEVADVLFAVWADRFGPIEHEDSLRERLRPAAEAISVARSAATE